MQHTQLGAGPVLLLLPGLGCDSRMWQPVAERLANRFTVVHPYTWGRGLLAARARELEKLVDSLETGAVGIAGLSMGGYLTFECLRQWPESIRAVALLDTTAFEDDAARVETREQVLRLLGQGRYSEVLGTFIPSVLSTQLRDNDDAQKLMLTMAKDLGPSTFSADLRAILERGEFTDVLPLIRVPALFAAGAEDLLTPADIARQMAAQVPGSRVVEIPDAGHMTPLENPVATARVLDEFFAAAFHL